MAAGRELLSERGLEMEPMASEPAAGVSGPGTEQGLGSPGRGQEPVARVAAMLVLGQGQASGRGRASEPAGVASVEADLVALQAVAQELASGPGQGRERAQVTAAVPDSAQADEQEPQAIPGRQRDSMLSQTAECPLRAWWQSESCRSVPRVRRCPQDAGRAWRPTARSSCQTAVTTRPASVPVEVLVSGREPGRASDQEAVLDREREVQAASVTGRGQEPVLVAVPATDGAPAQAAQSLVGQTEVTAALA